MPSNTYYLDEDNTIPVPQKGSRRFNPRTQKFNMRPVYCYGGFNYSYEPSQIVPNVRAWKKTKGFREKFVKKTKHYVKSDF
jgi:hypothetical protein